MKITLTVDDATCRQSFKQANGATFLFPGQGFKPINDLLESNKCDGVYGGPRIDDDLECNRECPAEGSDVTVLIQDSVSHLPISGATFALSRDGVGVLTGTSNNAGMIFFNVSYAVYDYVVKNTGYTDKPGKLTVDGCKDAVVTMVKQHLAPFNIHGFFSVPGIYDAETGSDPGYYPLAGFFGVPLSPQVPPGNAAITKWRIRTDDCAESHITYYDGDMDDRGFLLTSGIDHSTGLNAWFDPVTMRFMSQYTHPEGLWLQFGVEISGVMTWLPTLPCVEDLTE